MAKLIQQRRVVTDPWLLLKASAEGAPSGAEGAPSGSEGAPPSVPAEGDVIIPLSLWLARKDALAMRSGRTGVWLESKDGPEAIAADLNRLPLVAVHFPSLADGRGYSIARLLRERYRYKGEVRAIGAVFKDTLLGMERCGFDTFLLRDGEDADDAITAFDELADPYQANTTQPIPLFRRRAAQ